MNDVKYLGITVRITGVNGNAFNILGICTAEMRKTPFLRKRQAAVMMICFVLS